MTIDNIKEVYDEFSKELQQWIQTNKLSTIKDFKEYQDAKVWGQAYRNDQDHFEKISDHKNMVFGVISLTEKIRAEGDRAAKTKADTLLETLSTDLKKLDNLLFTARERLRFYENLMRVIGNATWGTY